MRLGVYTDYPYHRSGGEVHAARAFALFVARLAPDFSGLTVIGRLDPAPVRTGYPLGTRVGFVPLPYYQSLAHPGQVLRTIGRAMWRFWRALDDLDAVWVLGPHGFAIPFALLAAIRGKRVVLGVRQELIPYVRARHPGRRRLLGLAMILEYSFRVLARRWPVIVVGPGLARSYGGAKEMLVIAVSMVRDADIVEPPAPGPLEGDLTVLSVGRLETEKNPLLLADILARLRSRGRPWRLLVCGEGPLGRDLAARLEELGLSADAELRGYVPLDGGLQELYLESDIFLHVSWTEGMPQVILEAFAAGLPTVATDVGGVREGMGEAVRLVPAGDAEAAAAAVEAVADDPKLRHRLIETGHAHIRAHTIERESGRVSSLIRGARPEGS